MPDKKISEMTAASAYTGTNEFYEIVQGGNTRQGSHALLKSYFDTLYGPAVKYAKYTDTKSAGTAAGTFTSGSFATRVINTEDSDSGNIGTLSGNQITLQAGTYRLAASAPAFVCDKHQTKWRNVTDGADVLIGTPEEATSASSVQTRSFICGEFTIAGAKAFEVQHRCSTTRATDGLGRAANFGISEVYTIVEIWKVA